MRLSPLVARLGGSEDSAWDLHFEAVASARAGAGTIVLTIGDPDLDTPPEVTDAAVAALRCGDTHYTAAAGRMELREAIARLHSAASGIDVSARNVVACCGAQGALFSAALALFAPGDEILVPDPVYVSYGATVRAAGAVPVAVPTAPGTLRIYPSAMEAAATPRTRGILLANPSNPVGHAMRAGELEAVSRLAVRLGLWVISDEVYSSLTYDRPHVCAASVPGMQERTVTLGSLSKSHAMTGWRCGWAVGPEEAAAGMAALAGCMTHSLPSFIQTAAVEAIRLHAECSARTLAVFRRRRDLMVSLLGDIPGIGATEPEAGMFVLADVRATGMGSAEFARRLFEAAGVAVLDAAVFGASTAGCVRLSLAVPEGAIVEACGRIAVFVAACRRPGHGMAA